MFYGYSFSENFIDFDIKFPSEVINHNLLKWSWSCNVNNNLLEEDTDQWINNMQFRSKNKKEVDYGQFFFKDILVD